jgi:hypothetical protein
MEQERAIQSSIAMYRQANHTPAGASVDRMLDRQQARLGANIALLEQRYEMLPHPGRFQPLYTTDTPLTRTSRPLATPANAVFLSGLAAQHTDLQRKVGWLIAQRPDGERGELILAEIARNHAEMARMAAGVIKDGVSAHDSVPIATTASAASDRLP